MLCNSTTWNDIKALLPPEGRKYIMQAIAKDTLEARQQKSTVPKGPIQFHSWNDLINIQNSAWAYFGAHSPEYKVIAGYRKDWEDDFKTIQKEHDWVKSLDDLVDYMNDSVEDSSLSSYPVIKNWIKRKMAQ